MCEAKVTAAEHAADHQGGSQQDAARVTPALMSCRQGVNVEKTTDSNHGNRRKRW